jgi:probable rRNA maturation factor
MSSTFSIDIQSDLSELLEAELLADLELEQLYFYAEKTLHHQEVEPPASLSILLSDDAHLQQLNRDFRGYDQTTDVLSFADGTDLPDIGLYLGDIAISVPQAQRQAVQNKHELIAELRLLVVHGVLHLLGHDHAEDEEKTVMWQAQAEILAESETNLPE